MTPIAFTLGSLWFSAVVSATAGFLVGIVALVVLTGVNRKARINAKEFIQTLGLSRALKISVMGEGTIERETTDGGLYDLLPQVANNSSNFIISSIIIRNTDPVHPVDIKLISDETLFPPAHVQFLPPQG